MILWIKAAHLIAVICWFAGLFYLPRLFVYHALADDVISIRRFKTMQRRLYYGIMMPSLALSIIFGLWLLYLLGVNYLLNSYWLLIKLFLVFLLIIYHFYCGHLLTVFAQDSNKKSDKFYRLINEIPVLFLLLIVVLAVVKPF